MLLGSVVNNCLLFCMGLIFHYVRPFFGMAFKQSKIYLCGFCQIITKTLKMNANNIVSSVFDSMILL